MLNVLFFSVERASLVLQLSFAEVPELIAILLLVVFAICF
jgi:hypothetical protein